MRTARHKPSELYLLRLWLEDDDGTPLCCGRLQQTVSGAEHQFRGLDGLTTLVAELMKLEPNTIAGDTSGERSKSPTA